MNCCCLPAPITSLFIFFPTCPGWANNSSGLGMDRKLSSRMTATCRQSGGWLVCLHGVGQIAGSATEQWSWSSHWQSVHLQRKQLLVTMQRRRAGKPFLSCSFPVFPNQPTLLGPVIMQSDVGVHRKKHLVGKSQLYVNKTPNSEALPLVFHTSHGLQRASCSRCEDSNIWLGNI